MADAPGRFRTVEPRPADTEGTPLRATALHIRRSRLRTRPGYSRTEGFRTEGSHTEGSHTEGSRTEDFHTELFRTEHSRIRRPIRFRIRRAPIRIQTPRA